MARGRGWCRVHTGGLYDSSTCDVKRLREKIPARFRALSSCSYAVARAALVWLGLSRCCEVVDIWSSGHPPQPDTNKTERTSLRVPDWLKKFYCTCYEYHLSVELATYL